jgi:outer membrane lipoprotein-sorting protein
MQRTLLWMAAATLAGISGGCGHVVTSKQNVPPGERPVAREATREELLEKYNAFASSVKTVNSTVELKTTAGSKYSGLIQQYHEVKAFLLAARPAEVRMIGQAPLVGTTVFDMASDGSEFRVWIPSKNKFLVGQVSVERNSEKPLENLRPQHLLDAVLWEEIRKDETLLIEEFNDENARYYVLTELQGAHRMEIYRKIWFDRADLNVVRLQTFAGKGELVSDIHFSDWQPISDAPLPANGPAAFPRGVLIDRPHDDYKLQLTFTKVQINLELEASRFQISQPAGAEVVRVTAADAGKSATQGTRQP